MANPKIPNRKASGTYMDCKLCTGGPSRQTLAAFRMMLRFPASVCGAFLEGWRFSFYRFSRTRRASSWRFQLARMV